MKKLQRNLKEIAQYADVRFLNASSTVRTSAGFVRTLFQRQRSGTQLTDIFNYLRISPQIDSAGQPTRSQFSAIQSAGFQRVINLAPHHAENAIHDEQQLVESLGMDYVHIPVDFGSPSEADFQQFCAAMQENPERRVFVHCAANMRVSAFLYRYRVQILGEAEETARPDLEKIWKPFGTWQRFIGD